jgi:small subunit ribosomal protein S6
MANYELTLVLDGKTTAAKKKSQTESVEKIVKILDGKIVKTEEWGVKDLSYKIGKSEAGLFLHYLLEMGEKGVKGLMQKLRAEEEVIRYLLVKSEARNPKS